MAEEKQPKIISMFPLPTPEKGLPYSSYYRKGGRFGPHNQHHYQNQAALFHPENIIFMTYFNAGLRVFDISEPYDPREVGYFVPTDPKERRGLWPTTLVTQFEDVIVDKRGYIYCTDKNHGLFILKYTGKLS
jgi:hypothetical protein